MPTPVSLWRDSRSYLTELLSRFAACGKTCQVGRRGAPTFNLLLWNGFLASGGVELGPANLSGGIPTHVRIACGLYLWGRLSQLKFLRDRLLLEIATGPTSQCRISEGFAVQCPGQFVELGFGDALGNDLVGPYMRSGQGSCNENFVTANYDESRSCEREVPHSRQSSSASVSHFYSQGLAKKYFSGSPLGSLRIERPVRD